MAEAAVASPPSAAGRFFCHKCTQEINHVVLPEYVCPRCQSGFIEELRHQTSRSSDLFEDDASNADQANFEFLGFLDSPGHDSGSQSSGPQGQGGHSRVAFRTASYDRNNVVPPWEGIVQQIMTNLTGGAGIAGNPGFPVFLNLHANLGDYAWGRGGFDAIITQLLNQLDCTGPPPLTKEKINQIPTTKITQEQVDKVLQCTVCMEDFLYDETVSKLPCSHHFHHECIVPWLELHGTCPICRKLLSEFIGDETSSNKPSTTSTSSTDRSSEMGTTSVSSSSSSSSTSHPSSSSIYDFVDDLE